MRRKAIFFAGILIFVFGCASHLNYQKFSSNDIPFDKRKIPSLEKAIVIDPKGPSLDPKYYEIMGRAMAEVSDVSALESFCEDAIELLQIETERVGGDALINVSCSSRSFGASADGTIISFKNRQEALKVLRDIKAVLK
jgi:hypothetical protein